ncbi:MAG: efflux RND transporter permease subunit, partial [Sphingobacteriales bacterium]
IITLLASLIVAYIINPVFAVDFMQPHHDGEHQKPTFDKTVKKVLAILGGIALISYFVSFGLGNFIVFLILLYLLNHFYLTGAVKHFQESAWPRFQDRYASLLTWAVDRPRTMIFSTIGLFIFTIFLVGAFPPKVVFFPESDPNFLYVYVQLPVGTDQAYTNEVVKKVEDKVTKVVGGKDNKIVSSIISNVTVGVTDPQDEDQGEYTNKGKVTVAFVEFGKRDGASTAIYLDKIRNAVKGIPGAQISVTKEQSGPPTAKPISIEITSDNLDSIVRTADKLKKYLDAKQIAGVEELRSDFQNNKPEILFDIDRERANREGISTGQIGKDLRTAIYGMEASKFRDDDEDYEINVRAQEDQRNNLQAIRNMKVTYRDMAMGGMIRQVPMSSFAEIDYVNTYGGIKRKQQKRIIILSSNVLG